MRRISTINPVIKENMECFNVRVHAPVINQKVGVLLDHNIIMLHFQLLQTLWVIFQVKIA